MREKCICYEPKGEQLANGEDPTWQPFITSRFDLFTRSVRLLKCMDTCNLGITSLQM